MTTGTLKVHSENILPIIKKWLYTEKDIFVRELISNACDACQKLRFLSNLDQSESPSATFRIDVTINASEKTLTFSDNGIGMDASEIEKYIAQIAFSGAEEFVQSYQTNDIKDQFIGHFGLGFYSSYMVAEKVVIESLSFREGQQPARWICDGTSSYNLQTGTRSTRGTDVILSISPDNEEYLKDHTIRQLLKRYCAFLPIPIFLNGTPINDVEPLWIKNSTECTSHDYQQFYRELFPFEEQPLFWVHLNVDYPFLLKGILYFPKIRKDWDWQKNSVKLFCNRVFVANDCKDILPEYLNILQGAIDCPDIPLNVSRSALQVDKTVRQISHHIAKKVADSLLALYKNEREQFYSIWEQASLIIKLGIVQDEKFYEKAKEFLIWKTTEGNWITIEEYRDSFKDKTSDKIFYVSTDSFSTSLLSLYKNKGIPVLVAPGPVDHAVISFLEKKLGASRFHRIDAHIDTTFLDTTREKTLLDTEGKTESSKIADCIKNHLENQVEVQAKSLIQDDLPSLLLMEEEQRRYRDAMLRFSETPSTEIGKTTFVVNTNNPIVNGIYRMSNINPTLAQQISHQLFDLTLLSQHELKPENLNKFLSRSEDLLKKLIESFTNKENSS